MIAALAKIEFKINVMSVSFFVKMITLL